MMSSSLNARQVSSKQYILSTSCLALAIKIGVFESYFSLKDGSMGGIFPPCSPMKLRMLSSVLLRRRGDSSSDLIWRSLLKHSSLYFANSTSLYFYKHSEGVRSLMREYIWLKYLSTDFHRTSSSEFRSLDCM